MLKVFLFIRYNESWLSSSYLANIKGLARESHLSANFTLHRTLGFDPKEDSVHRKWVKAPKKVRFTDVVY
jgi:hypothetical protein